MNDDRKKRARFGWCCYDWANSAFATVIMAALFPVYFTSLVPAAGVELLPGHRISPTALWGYLVSLSMAAVALSAPYLGALADHRGDRRKFLAGFTLAGAFATALLSLAGPGDYLLAGGLFLAANFSFASANVFYNAFLPALARGPAMDRLSSRGFAFGYLGGGLALALCFLMVQWPERFLLPDREAAVRAGLLLTGLWWGLFAVPTFLLLREEGLVHPPGRLVRGLKGYLKILREACSRRDLLLFLVAFLCYNDAIQTVVLVSAIFARQELGMERGTILACFLMIQFVAMPGALLFGALAGRVGTKKAIQLALGLFTAATTYAFFIRETWEFWVLAAVVAVVLGGSQSLSRSLFASLIPSGKNAEFFGFYAISAKFASIFGPLLFALVADFTGSTRLSILALTGLFLAGMILLGLVDVERGRAETGR